MNRSYSFVADELGNVVITFTQDQRSAYFSFGPELLTCLRSFASTTPDRLIIPAKGMPLLTSVWNPWQGNQAFRVEVSPDHTKVVAWKARSVEFPVPGSGDPRDLLGSPSSPSEGDDPAAYTKWDPSFEELVAELRREALER